MAEKELGDNAKLKTNNGFWSGLAGGLLGGIGEIVSAGIKRRDTEDTNAANERMNEANNEANAANVAATNETNQEMNEATNKANKEINEATNKSNEDIAAATNEANKAINDAVNATNKTIAEENLNYQREYNQTIFEREDNALQRKLQDSIKSGINILSGTEGSGTGGTAVPLNNAYERQGYEAQGYTAQGYTETMERAEAAHSEATKYQPMERIANIGNSINNGIMTAAQISKTNAETTAENIGNSFIAEKEEAEILKTRAEVEELHKRGKIEDAEYEEYIKGSNERLKTLRLTNEATEENIKKTKADTENLYANTNNTKANTRLTEEKTKTETVTRNDNHIMNQVQMDLMNLEQDYLKQTIDERVLKEKLENEFTKANTDKQKAQVIETYVRTGTMVSSEIRNWISTLTPKKRASLFDKGTLTSIESLMW